MDWNNIELNKESSQALRELAEKTKTIISDIDAATQTLQNNYHSASDGLGVHADQIEEIISEIKKAEEKLSEPVRLLPELLANIADKIDAYIKRLHF